MAGQYLLKKILLTGVLVLGVCFFVRGSFLPVRAVDPPSLKNINQPLDTIGGQVSDTPGYVGDSDPIYSTIGSIVSIASFFVGVVLALMIIYAGFLWMLAGGNEEQITKAKSIIVNSLIAAAIIAGAWLITMVAVNFASINGQ